MTLLSAIHDLFDSTPALAAAIPGGLHQDFVIEETVAKPYAVLEDGGGTHEVSSTGDGPENHIFRFWVLSDDPSMARAGADKIVGVFDDAVLATDGGEACAMRTSPAQFVTDPQVMKNVREAHQVSVEYTFQI